MSELDEKKKSLHGLYADFITPQDASIKRAFDDPNDQGIFKELINLFFPEKPSFNSTEKMWKSIKNLTLDPTELATKDAYSKFIAERLRVYYYGAEDSCQTETNIQEWYKQSKTGAGAYRTSNREDDKEYTSFTEMINSFLPEGKKLKNKLALFAIDTPAIDLRLRNADKVSTFINYMPGVMISQAVPFVDVKFSFNKRRRVFDRDLSTMSQLKFLLGPDELQDGSITSDKKSSANQLIYDASVDIRYEQPPRKDPSVPSLEATIAADVQNKVVEPEPKEKQLQVARQIMTTGMELFTMPQTLVNMDYDHSTKNYNSVLNKVLPFGSITNVTISITPSVGLFSYKTAILTLKIFDKSRLVEIADFLNPKLYQKSLIWITYGWRAPSHTDNFYNQFINQYMLKREAFGVRNSSISIDDSGIATITLNLFTKGAAEFSTVSPINKTNSFDKVQDAFNEKILKLKELIEDSGLATLTSGVKDIRGSQIISAAVQGTVASIDANSLFAELKTLQAALGNSANPQTKDILSIINSLYPKDKNSKISQTSEALTSAAKQLADERIKTPDIDLFKMYKNKFKEREGYSHPFEKSFDITAELDSSRVVTYRDAQNKAKNKASTETFSSTFGGILTSFFTSAMSTIDEDDSDDFPEYQIFFYNLNKYAGKAAGTNIADFPIDEKKLQSAYAEYVVSQKGENVTLLNFLEIIKSSQFSNPAHRLYGFKTFFSEDGTLIKEDKKNNTKDQTEPYLIASTLNEGPDGKPLGKAFSLPAVDFLIESGYEERNNDNYDLLRSFDDVASKKRNSGHNHIIRIHIYDKSSTPHFEAASVFIDGDGSDFFSEVSEEEMVSRAKRDIRSINDEQKVTDALTSLKKQKFSMHAPTRFEQVKKRVAEQVPTITIGTNGTIVKNVSYSSEQDSLLSTIMMLRSKSNDESVTSANGAGKDNIPLRVIPGALSLSLLGCPIVEYMQQFFIDLGTGTTIDNMYNVTGITHNISPGSFSTELKFTFLDAYGKYEVAQTQSNYINKIAKSLRQNVEAKK